MNQKAKSETHKPILIGGLGEINYGKQYRCGNRVYDSNAVGMCIMSQPIGNIGGQATYMSLNQKMDDTNKPILIGRLIPDSNKIHQHSEVLSPSGTSQTILSTYYKNQPKIIVLCDMDVEA